jgi:hypothetical protein
VFSRHQNSSRYSLVAPECKPRAAEKNIIKDMREPLSRVLNFV